MVNRPINICYYGCPKRAAFSRVESCPPLLQTRLSGALAMAANETKILEANVQKVIARLKAI